MATATEGTQLLNANDLLQQELDLQSGMIYADLGIGTAGHFIYTAARIVGPEGRVYGLDIMKSSLAAAESNAKQQGLSNIKLIWTDLEVYGAAKEIKNDSIDRMSIVNLLFQTKKDEHVINEANRMLKTGGRCIIIDWLPEGALFGPPIAERTSLDKVRKIAQLVGWKEVHQFSPSDFHFGVVFEK